MNPIIKQIFHTQAFKVVVFFSQMLFFVFLAKNFSPDKLGIYYLIGTILTVGTYAFGFDLYAYVRRIVPGKTEHEGIKIFKTVLLFEL